VAKTAHEQSRKAPPPIALARAAFAPAASPRHHRCYDTRRPVVYANPAFEKFFGLRPGEAAGQPFAPLVFRGDEAKLYRLLAQGAAQREIDTWTKDGSARHVEMTLGAVRDPEGRLTYWVAGFADLEHLKALAVAA
jgi:PAS domain S-box-containing protein